MNPNRLPNLTYGVWQFMQWAGQPTDKFNAEQACLYTGLQLEEMAEKLEAVVTGTVTQDARHQLEQGIAVLKQMAAEFKSGMHQGDILRADRAALLDADIDLAWVSIGAAYSTSKNAGGAVNEVMRANFEKVSGGNPIRDENGKIVKPAGWRPPELEQFVENSLD